MVLCCLGVTIETGDEVTAVVIDVDLVECCLVFSLNQQLFPTSTSGRVLRSASKRKSSAGETLEPMDLQEAIVEHKTSYYFVLSYSNGPGQKLAYGVMDAVSVCICTTVQVMSSGSLSMYLLWPA